MISLYMIGECAMKKKGFTLIELLAVIIILAILALILTPMIQDLILNARKSAFERSIDGILAAAEYYQIENPNSGDVIFECDGTSCKDSNGNKLIFKGEVPISGTVEISEGRIVAEEVCNHSFCGSGTKEGIVISEGSGGASTESVIFNYNGEHGFDGSIQTYMVPKTGLYKLEVWGAQGGNTSEGKGGYGAGYLDLTEGSMLAVVVGGRGTARNDSLGTGRGKGGYNGGGDGAYNGAGGGGATHIAIYNENYTTLASYVDEETAKGYVYIVAGGGGGQVYGGAGGGFTGGIGYGSNSGDEYDGGTGGTQAQGGTNTNYSCGGSNTGSFGQGGTTCRDSWSGGGGGGFYGGGASMSGKAGGGGGSGYANIGVKNVTKLSGVREGDGYAAITYVGNSRKEIGNSYIFDFVGDSIQTFTALSGTYKLEVWGAEGGSYNETYHGGYGGYSVGEIKLNKNDILYIAVGGAGKHIGSNRAATGGYNGGGGLSTWSDGNERRSTGGGATHIALNTNLGELKYYVDNQDAVLIVAGGGGGGQANSVMLGWGNSGGGGYGGSGGGTTGGHGHGLQYAEVLEASGGTQTNAPSGAGFGYGGSTINNDGNATGAGGGWYGGQGLYRGAGGGSGHLSTGLKNAHMACYNCMDTYDDVTVNTDSISPTAEADQAKQGNGYAKITFISN